MLPDFIIYDELKKEREKREQLRERPRLEIPCPLPYLPDPEEETSEHEDGSERGVAILQFWVDLLTTSHPAESCLPLRHTKKKKK